MDKNLIDRVMKFAKRLTLLFVEDNESARNSSVELLSMFFENIIVAIDGEDGIEKFKNNNIDIIITDINMPNKDGIEMIKEIREINEDIPILVITAFNESQYLLESIKYSVDDYILKPIEINSFVKVMSKIINKIRLEIENKQYKENLEELVNIQIEKIKEQSDIISYQSKLALMGEMVDSIAHQWKQPLNIIYAITQNIVIASEISEVSKDDIKECNEKIKVQVEHLVNTIDEFRKFFREDKAEEVFIQDIIDSVLLLLEDTLKKYNIKIEVDIDNKKLLLVPNEFKHILINLINNAKDEFKHNNNRKIRIYSEIDSKYYILNILDNAGGVPEDLIDKIFNVNFTTKENMGGTGIGLYLSKKIIEKIGGEIGVFNKDDGANFYIKIPFGDR